MKIKLSIILLLIFYNFSFSQLRSVVDTVNYIYSDDDSKNSTRQKATRVLLKKVSDKYVGVIMEVYTDMETIECGEEFKQNFCEIIKEKSTIAAKILDIVDEKWDNKTNNYSLVAKVEIDLGKIKKIIDNEKEIERQKQEHDRILKQEQEKQDRELLRKEKEYQDRLSMKEDMIKIKEEMLKLKEMEVKAKEMEVKALKAIKANESKISNSDDIGNNYNNDNDDYDNYKVRRSNKISNRAGNIEDKPKQDIYTDNKDNNYSESDDDEIKNRFNMDMGLSFYILNNYLEENSHNKTNNTLRFYVAPRFKFFKAGMYYIDFGLKLSVGKPIDRSNNKSTNFMLSPLFSLGVTKNNIDMGFIFQRSVVIRTNKSNDSDDYEYNFFNYDFFSKENLDMGWGILYYLKYKKLGISLGVNLGKFISKSYYYDRSNYWFRQKKYKKTEKFSHLYEVGISYSF